MAASSNFRSPLNTRWQLHQPKDTASVSLAIKVSLQDCYWPTYFLVDLYDLVAMKTHSVPAYINR